MAGARILLVDDEQEITENMAKLLENRGYHVRAVNSGHDAIQALAREKFDLMVLDLKMPGMDGMATLREVRKLNLSVETLILTGHGAIETALEAMKLGAYDYLSKPCEIKELVEKIEDAKKESSGSEKKSILGLFGKNKRK